MSNFESRSNFGKKKFTSIKPPNQPSPPVNPYEDEDPPERMPGPSPGPLKSMAAVTPASSNTSAKLKWKTIQTDLKSALNEWSEMENEVSQKTPEQEQLDKVKSLIENLKDKLNEF